MLKNTIFLFLLVTCYTHAQEKYYELHDFVTDSANIFTPDQEVDLNQRLVEFEDATTNQLVVVTIQELGFDTIESYANGLFNKNRIGQEGKDNGLLILFSEVDQEVRIEVGYGLEPYITDAVASRIIRNTMIPNFKKEEYFLGIDQATNQLIAFLNNPEALDEFKREIVDEEHKEELYSNLFLGVFLSIFIGVGGFFFFKSYKNILTVLRGIFIGKLGVLPGIFMLLVGSLSTLLGMLFMIVPLYIAYGFYSNDQDITVQFFDNPTILLWLLLLFFAIAAIIAFVQLKLLGKEQLRISWLKNDKAYYSKTFSSTGSRSFGSGSSSTGGGSSFSGGGGSSGGGGASGSW